MWLISIIGWLQGDYIKDPLSNQLKSYEQSLRLSQKEEILPLSCSIKSCLSFQPANLPYRLQTYQQLCKLNSLKGIFFSFPHSPCPFLPLSTIDSVSLETPDWYINLFLLMKKQFFRFFFRFFFLKS